MTPWEREHLQDPPDFSDSYALLDDGQVIAEVEPVDPTESEDRDYLRNFYRWRHRDR